ncbi:unnamed protein product [Litomosoides sigmodontis]|uniref:Cytochrome-b5 reductase n=1 Tax=Litomosoides sigmodontis TaxID=42156 RepID=A0A3P6TYY3_LITSI|nr:unnamed protein product [Litomosoides sigmodontis]
MMLPVPQNFQSRASEAKRPKVALTHGRSLMHWIKLTSSKCTEAKVKRGIDHVELSKHASVGDCWILLGERVYDVTDYLAFHPGGVEELMRAAGTDGTDLFNKSHAWVNYATMLKTCFVGTFNGDRYKLSNPKTTDFIKQANSNDVSFEAAGITYGILLKLGVEINFDGELRVSCSKWDQLRDENVSLEFTENVLRLLLHFSTGETEELQWTNLLATIFDKPCSVNISGKTISLPCKKIDENVTRQWTSGLYHYKPVLKYRNCEIFKMDDVTYNTCLIVLRMMSHCRLMVPVGHHVMLRICVMGSLIERPYSPVVVSEDGQFISFMIKFYENGVFTSKLRNKKCGDLIEISDALGCFNMRPDYAGKVLMLAAGTGLTSMIRFTAERLKSMKKATIIVFNKKEMDIVPDDYFMEYGIPPNHPLVEIKHYLSEADQEWNGARGIISKQILSEYVDGSAEKTTCRVLISGPKHFIDLAARFLEQLEVPSEHVHIFQS